MTSQSNYNTDYSVSSSTKYRLFLNINVFFFSIAINFLFHLDKYDFMLVTSWKIPLLPA